MNQDAYAIDMGWPGLLKEIGIRTANVLRRADLPEDLFAHPSARVDTASYFRFWEALKLEAGDELFPLRLYSALRSEAFSPPLFAAVCSPDLLTALHRLAKFKPLIAPIRLEIVDEHESVTARMVWLDVTLPPPPTLVLAELLFLICLARIGTHEAIRPGRLTTETLPTPIAPYEEFVGLPIRKGKEHAVVFRKVDATKPFLSTNEAMWSIFEPELRRRLSELDASASTKERVRAVLLEGLPGGNATMDAVARKLALSKRTLQRRLEDEGTSYQAVLRATREALAIHYLERTTIPAAEISFLLGFDEPNSFFRAFSDWTGQTPEALRRAAIPRHAPAL